MAIQIGGTTVVNNQRDVVNVLNVNATTNVISSGNVSGNFLLGNNVRVSTNVVSSGNVSGNFLLGNNVRVSTNVVSLGNVSGNFLLGDTVIVSTNVISSGNVSASYYFGDGSKLSNVYGGSGAFNTFIDKAVGYDLTTTMANAFVAPSTTGYQYIVHSIHVTNTSIQNVNISGQIVGANYSNVSIANTIPLPKESAVELIKRPKVLQPGEYIQLSEEGSGTSYATITVESLLSNKYFGKGVDITTAATYTDIHTASANSVIESLLLVNDDPVLDVKATVVWTDGSNSIQGYYSANIIIPADATVELFEKPKFLPNTHKIRILANQANRLEAIISGKTI